VRHLPLAHASRSVYHACSNLLRRPWLSNLLGISNRRKRDFLQLWAGLQAGLCPDALDARGFGTLCRYWRKRSANPDDYEDGCSLTEECGPICTRDPEFAGSDRLYTGHTAGFDLFSPAWCFDAKRQLPTDQTREFWFPRTGTARCGGTSATSAARRGSGRSMGALPISGGDARPCRGFAANTGRDTRAKTFRVVLLGLRWALGAGDHVFGGLPAVPDGDCAFVGRA
jgi:hypothetical protein